MQGKQNTMINGIWPKQYNRLKHFRIDILNSGGVTLSIRVLLYTYFLWKTNWCVFGICKHSLFQSAGKFKCLAVLTGKIGTCCGRSKGLTTIKLAFYPIRNGSHDILIKT